MRWLFNKIVCILIELLGIVINIANAFMTNIAIYEATNGLSFDFGKLLSNKLFWVVLIIQFAYGITSICVHFKSKNSDERLLKAIEDEEIVLVTQIGENVKKGDFDSAHKIIKILDKLQRRRK